MICTKCNKKIDGKHAGAHKRWCGYVKKKKQKIGKTCKCGNEFSTTLYRPTSYCSSSCASKYSLTKEVKERISRSRKKYLRENPEKHPWKNKKKHISEPCELFKDYLRRNNVSFQSEVTPLKDRLFSIDIAFPEEKIGIEINGNQHYNADKTLKKYYQSRHDLIVSSGWRLFEIHYSQCFSDDKMEKILSHIRNHALLEYKYEFEIKKKKSRLKSSKTNKMQSDAIKERRERILKIDPQSYGWVTRASKELGLSHSQIKRFVDEHMQDIQVYRRSKKNKKSFECK